MEKTYKSSSSVALNIVLPTTGKNHHVSFVSLSNGTSEFTTSDEAVQQGLERHYLFGSLFSLAQSIDTQEATPTDEDEEESSTTVDTDEELEEVEVSDIAAAKDYLATKYGESRTKITSKNIDKKAAEHGVKFIYPE